MGKMGNDKPKCENEKTGSPLIKETRIIFNSTVTIYCLLK